MYYCRLQCQSLLLPSQKNKISFPFIIPGISNIVLRIFKGVRYIIIYTLQAKHGSTASPTTIFILAILNELMLVKTKFLCPEVTKTHKQNVFVLLKNNNSFKHIRETFYFIYLWHYACTIWKEILFSV